jgi:hypothetical protein
MIQRSGEGGRDEQHASEASACSIGAVMATSIRTFSMRVPRAFAIFALNSLTRDTTESAWGPPAMASGKTTC